MSKPSADPADLAFKISQYSDHSSEAPLPTPQPHVSHLDLCNCLPAAFPDPALYPPPHRQGLAHLLRTLQSSRDKLFCPHQPLSLRPHLQSKFPPSAPALCPHCCSLDTPSTCFPLSRGPPPDTHMPTHWPPSDASPSVGPPLSSPLPGISPSLTPFLLYSSPST